MASLTGAKIDEFKIWLVDAKSKSIENDELSELIESFFEEYKDYVNTWPEEKQGLAPLSEALSKFTGYELEARRAEIHKCPMTWGCVLNVQIDVLHQPKSFVDKVFECF